MPNDNDMVKDIAKARQLLDQSGIHPLIMLLSCVEALDWGVMLSNNEETVDGLIVGTAPYMEKHLADLTATDIVTASPPQSKENTN